MNWEINVSLNGQHFFATHSRSILTEDKAKQVYAALKAAFPKSQGYELSVSKRSEICQTVAWEPHANAELSDYQPGINQLGHIKVDTK